MNEPSDPPPPDQPTQLGGVSPDELFARAMYTVRMTSAGGAGWQPPPLEEVARLFPGYKFVKLLGRGGMGAVYQALQIELDRFVAIKLLPLEISVDPAFVDRFRREARAMAKLHHPNIITVFEFGQTKEGHLFFVMEYVEGANLAEVIRQVGLNEEQALAIVEQVCTALAYAHQKGVVHRDIKPANVMIDTESHVKVADFGLARLTGPGTESFGTTMTGTIMGTPDYMAPEQMRGMNVDHRADIYSLGVMLYEMLCKEVPKGIFDPPSHRTGCDDRIDAIVIKAMHQSPDRRYQTTREMQSDIVAARTPVLFEEMPATQIVQPRPVARPALPAPKAAALETIEWTEQPRKSRLPLYASVAAVALAAIVAAIVWAKRPKPAAGPPPPPTFATASKDAPFVNGLGMKFVPVPIAGGTAGGQRVLFSIWETRIQDYETFTKAKGVTWLKPPFPQDPTHPIVNVSWRDAQAFCAWLTEQERSAGKIGAKEFYRLPTDHEWSCAIGVGELEDAAKTPFAKNGKLADIFPWGSFWPPPLGTANISGEETVGLNVRPVQGVQRGYNDGFPYTAPAGSFPANQFGIHDLCGNVWEWCEDLALFKPNDTSRVIRGGSFEATAPEIFLSSARDGGRAPTTRGVSLGFRVVLTNTPATPAVAAAPAPAPPAEAQIFGGHRYQVVVGGSNWAQAKSRTEAMGGHLATFTNEIEEAWARDRLLAPLGQSNRLYWIGGFAEQGSRDIRWVTGEPFGKVRWRSGNPGWRESPGNPETKGKGVLFPGGLSAGLVAATGEWLGIEPTDYKNAGFIIEWDEDGAPAKPPVTNVPIAAAAKDRPFVNGLGMRFVPVPVIGGPTGGQRVLFSVWETRVQDFQVFAKEKGIQWQPPNFSQGPTHPAVNLNWPEAQGFCAWLTERERKAGRLGANELYRLPTDHEWSCAAGIGDVESLTQTPKEKSLKIPDSFPWDTGWPPPPDAGNYSGLEAAGHELLAGQDLMDEYRDGFPQTAPVGRFDANRFGLHDLGGNAWEWCEDLLKPGDNANVVRGASFSIGNRGFQLSSYRNSRTTEGRSPDLGFRVVLAPAPTPP